MNANELAQFRDVLEELIARVRGDADAMTSQTRRASGGQADGELTNAPMHLGDRGTDEYLYDLDALLLENEESLGRETLDALERIKLGTYGRCEDCGKPVGKKRLQAIPYARYCVSCARTEETGIRRANINTGRPRVAADTLAPEGESREYPSRPRHRPASHSSARGDAGDITSDPHAAGTAGGGTALGGLAGSNRGHGDPEIGEIEVATGSSDFDFRDVDDEGDSTPQADLEGKAIGGTPSTRRNP